MSIQHSWSSRSGITLDMMREFVAACDGLGLPGSTPLRTKGGFSSIRRGDAVMTTVSANADDAPERAT